MEGIEIGLSELLGLLHESIQLELVVLVVHVVEVHVELVLLFAEAADAVVG